MVSFVTVTVFFVVLGCAVAQTVFPVGGRVAPAAWANDPRLIPAINKTQAYFNPADNGTYPYFIDCDNSLGHAVFSPGTATSNPVGGRFQNPQDFVKKQIDDWCTQCPQNSFAPVYGMWECILTPPGWFTTYTPRGAQYPNACTKGYKCLGQYYEPELCQAGTFQNQIGQSTCLDCPSDANHKWSTADGTGCVSYAPSRPQNCTYSAATQNTTCTDYTSGPNSPANWVAVPSTFSGTSLWSDIPSQLPNSTTAGVLACDLWFCPAGPASGSGSGSASGTSTGTGPGNNPNPSGSATGTAKANSAGSVSASILVALSALALSFVAITSS